MYSLIRVATLVGATIATGLSAGLFYAFACSVMVALGRSDDRTFVDVMQRINVAILNGWFALSFVGALILTALAAALHIRGTERPALPWIVTGLVLYVMVVVITVGISVPLNNELAAAGHPDDIPDLAAVRAHFEATWVRWNIVRAVTATAAFGSLSWALRASRATGRS